jgi:hypothetical protein
MNVELAKGDRREAHGGEGRRRPRLRAAQLAALLAILAVAGACEEGPPEPDAAERDRLGALGYVTWTETADSEALRGSVTRYDPSASARGINYYCSEPSDTAYFVDMEGEVLHSLELPVADPFFDDNRCKLIEPYDAETVLMLHEHTQVSRLGLDSRIRWARRGRFHHDLAVASDGTIYALLDTPRHVPALHAERWILDTEIVALSPDGEILRRLRIWPMVADHPELLREARRWAGRDWGGADTVDPLHVNTIDVVGEVPGPSGETPLVPGDLLICIRNLDLVAVVDPRTARFRWRWGPGQIEGPHDPSVLPNGHLLVFDNGYRRGYSRVIELDPVRERIVWEYRGSPPDSFFTGSRGSVQSLPNGNLLITESMRGRVFEVTRSGETVWEFWNPELDAAKHRRATIYRMMRLAPAELRRLAFPSTVRDRLREAGYPIDP